MFAWATVDTAPAVLGAMQREFASEELLTDAWVRRAELRRCAGARVSAASLLFRSSRGRAAASTFSAALLQGLAPDGGLYVPEHWPQLPAEDFSGAHTLPQVAERLLAPFVAGDELGPKLHELVNEAFNFPAPLRGPRPTMSGCWRSNCFTGRRRRSRISGRAFWLRRFSAPAARRWRDPSRFWWRPPVTPAARSPRRFTGEPGIEVAVLFPKGLVSPTQERQLTCWGGNVRALAVRGTFDDCQRLVKEAFLDARLRARTALSSANSINLGRLLPQSVYYAAASLAILREHGERASFIVPSGNLGNALACLWARQLGLPIAQVVLAHNANRTVPDYLASGEWRPRASIATLASAMDVGDPSNMERLRALFPDLTQLRGAGECLLGDDARSAPASAPVTSEYGQIWCPHTAAAAEAWARLPAAARASGRWVLVATAHPAKFPEIVEPLIGRAVPVPASLATTVRACQ